MRTFDCPTALHLLLEQRVDVVCGGARAPWFLTVVHDPQNPIASVPVIVRVQLNAAGKVVARAPWPPNNGDLHSTQYRRRDGLDQEPVDFVAASSAWAFHLLLTQGKAVRPCDWPRRMHIRDTEAREGRRVVMLTHHTLTSSS